MIFLGFLILSILAVYTFNLIYETYRLIRKILTISKVKSGYLSSYNLHCLSPFEFEEWCKNFLIKLGYNDVQRVEIHGTKGDGGKDIICSTGGMKVYVECKRYHPEFGLVDSGVVEKLLGAMAGDEVYDGVIMTTGRLTKDAREFMESIPYPYSIEVLEGVDIENIYNGNTVDTPSIPL